MSSPLSNQRQRTSFHSGLLLAAIAAAVAPLSLFQSDAQPKKDDAGKGRIILWRYALDGVNSPGDAFLAAVNPADKKVTRLTKDPDAGATTFPIALSPDGRSVAYTKSVADGDNARFKVYVRPVDDPKHAGVSLGVDGYCPCWSADGKQVAVVTDQDGTLQHSLVDVKTKEKKMLDLPKVEAAKDAKGRVGHIVTDWSKDGQWFLTTCLTGNEKEEKTQLYQVKCDGSEAHAVKGVKSGRWGRFSPDGKRILYSAPDEKGQPRLFVVDVVGGKPLRLSPELNGSIDEAGFCWSPDGKKVAYLWLNTEKPQFGQEYEMFLMVIDENGQNPVTILAAKTPFVKPLRFPQWGQDNT